MAWRSSPPRQSSWSFFFHFFCGGIDCFGGEKEGELLLFPPLSCSFLSPSSPSKETSLNKSAPHHHDVGRVRVLERALQRHDVERAAQPPQHRDLPPDVVDVGRLPLRREPRGVEAFWDGLAGELGAVALVDDNADLKLKKCFFF